MLAKWLKLPFQYCIVENSSTLIRIIQDPKDTPPPTRVETREERLERRRREKAEQVAYKLEQQIALWDPASAPNSTSDPFKTLFVARIVSFVFYKVCFS